MSKVDPTQNPAVTTFLAAITTAVTLLLSNKLIDAGTAQTITSIAGIVLPAAAALGAFILKGHTNVATAQHAVAAAHVEIAQASREGNVIEATKALEQAKPTPKPTPKPKPAARVRKPAAEKPQS